MPYNAPAMAETSKPLRVCVISHACVVATNQALWASLVRAHPVDLTVLAPRTWRSVGGRLVRASALPGLEGRLETLTVLPRGRPTLHLWLGLSRALRRLRPDVVFLDEEPYSLAAAQVLAARRRTPFALVVYGKQNIAKRFPAPIARLQRALVAVADVLAAVHPAARDVFLAQGCEAPIRLLPHVLDPAVFSPGDGTAARERLGLRGFVIGYVGRLVPEKGVDDLLEAVALLEGDGAREGDGAGGGAGPAGAPLSVLLVGDGPERRRLEGLARSGLRSPVAFAGAVPHDEAPALYRAMDVLVLPSRTTRRWREQFGRTIIEALACGVAVVGPDSGSIPELIERTGGLIFPEGDVPALADALRKLLADPAARQALAEAGRQRVLDQFSADAVAREVYELLVDARDRHLARGA